MLTKCVRNDSTMGVLNDSENIDYKAEQEIKKSNNPSNYGGGKKYKCDPCGKSYKGIGKRSLYFHNKSVHCEQKKYKCDTCGKSYKEKKGLYLHNKNFHEGSKNV